MTGKTGFSPMQIESSGTYWSIPMLNTIYTSMQAHSARFWHDRNISNSPINNLADEVKSGVIENLFLLPFPDYDDFCYYILNPNESFNEGFTAGSRGQDFTVPPHIMQQQQAHQYDVQVRECYQHNCMFWLGWIVGLSARGTVPYPPSLLRFYREHVANLHGNLDGILGAMAPVRDFMPDTPKFNYLN